RNRSAIRTTILSSRSLRSRAVSPARGGVFSSDLRYRFSRSITSSGNAPFRFHVRKIGTPSGIWCGRCLWYSRSIFVVLRRAGAQSPPAAARYPPPSMDAGSRQPGKADLLRQQPLGDLFVAERAGIQHEITVRGFIHGRQAREFLLRHFGGATKLERTRYG